MDQTTAAVTPGDAAPPLSTRTAALVVGSIVGVIVAYLVIGSLLGIVPLFAGFLFIFYMTAVMKAELAAFPAALVGALAGVGVAWTLKGLPDQIGPVGYVLPLGLILALLLGAVLQRYPLLVNNSLWLFLSVGTIPAVQDHASFPGMLVATAYGAAFIGLLLSVAHVVTTRQARSAAAAAAAAPVTA